MDKIEFILTNFASDPITFTGCFVTIVITTVTSLIFLIRQVEDPVKQIFIYFANFFQQAMKEISGKAGYAGTMDLIIVIFMFILSICIFNSSSVAKTIGIPDGESHAYSILILFFTGFVFIASLKMSLDHEKFERLSKF